MTSSPTVRAGLRTNDVYPFDYDHGAPGRELADLLGGKGAGLAEMTTALGIEVPPGFTISLPICRRYRENGWPADLDAAIVQQVDRLGDVLGRRFGDASDPLLVAVRSGSPVSMPGMLDTILNLGINDQTVEGLAAVSRDERFAWDSYRRFLQMFATTVRDVEADRLPRVGEDASVEELRAHVAVLSAAITEHSGSPVPQDPFAQLREAVEAVFRSWDSRRAVAYREREGIDPDLGTAVNIQAMVFGNRAGLSGTGVAFTRDPRTGEPGSYGDYLPHAQGEDVVAGTARTLPLSDLAGLDSAVYDELQTVLRRLEVHYRDLCDVEFTVESGKIWFLQTRVGKRGAIAAVRIASDLVDDPDIALTPAEAVARVPKDLRDRARTELQSHGRDTLPEPLATGLGASGGLVTGRAVFTSQGALMAEGPVILIRPETSPEDVVGMSASAGVLTTAGGLVSHAAVVARGWGIPAVVGAHDLIVRDGALVGPGGVRIAEGEELTIDGATGRVWPGTVASTGAADVPAELLRLDEWARELEESA